MTIYQTRSVLITVKTYPTPARRSIEQSCTAGITSDGEWIRLFPIPFRLLTRDQQFKKWQWIKASVCKASDPRPESHHLDWDSIELMGKPVSTGDKWHARKEIVLPHQVHCLCCLKSERDANGAPTLGLVSPHGRVRLEIQEEESAAWTDEERRKLTQPQFFLTPPKVMLEKLASRFFYRFACDHGSCGGHRIHCTDWEMGQAYRAWRAMYGDDWERHFRSKFEAEMNEKNDLRFFVGTMAAHPSDWLIVGLFYPPI